MLTNRFKYQLTAQKGEAKAGLIKTPHGEIQTPVYMPVGTQATVKAMDNRDIEATGAEIILGNTYHLYLRPGTEILNQFGGLHRYMGWERPILTDSGGYQISSLGLFRDEGEPKLTTINEEGATFKSHLDGSMHQLTPEKAIQIQAAIGSDIMMALDEATPDQGKVYAQKSMERTHRWLERSKKAWQLSEELKRDGGEQEEGRGEAKVQALFGIIQGGNYQDLRRESAAFVVNCDLPGIALGGESVGQNSEVTSENVAWVRDLLPKNKPLYLMGVGISPQAAGDAVLAGADMFDCVAPTRLARCGLLYTGHLIIDSQGKPKFESGDENGRIQIEKRQYETDEGIIESTCDCYTCRKGYTRSYLRHLFKCHELTYYRLASIHNVRMMIKAVAEMRRWIVV